MDNPFKKGKVELYQKKTIKVHASAIKRAVIGSLIMEYALMDINGHQDFKQRINATIRQCRGIQSYLENHPDARPEHRVAFRQQFLKDNAVLIGELIELVWDLEPADMEELIAKIKANTDEVQEVSGDSVREDASEAGAFD